MSPQQAKMSTEQARGLAEYLVGDLHGEMPTTIRVIEAASGGNLDYAPDAKSMTALALIRHLVASDAWFLNSIADGAFVPGTTDESHASGIMTAADGAAKYKELVGAAAARVGAMSDAKAAEEIDFFGMMKLPAISYTGFMMKHSIHHRGQLSAYLRPMGCKVPGIYGSSGDSK
jgi:uncharacterized damage-inducible protein DinB